jgi:hypothetical protein
MSNHIPPQPPGQCRFVVSDKFWQENQGMIQAVAFVLLLLKVFAERAIFLTGKFII